jgi:hypothetical protein
MIGDRRCILQILIRGYDSGYYVETEDEDQTLSRKRFSGGRGSERVDPTVTADRPRGWGGGWGWFWEVVLFRNANGDTLAM